MLKMIHILTITFFKFSKPACGIVTAIALRFQFGLDLLRCKFSFHLTLLCFTVMVVCSSLRLMRPAINPMILTKTFCILQCIRLSLQFMLYRSMAYFSLCFNFFRTVSLVLFTFHASTNLTCSSQSYMPIFLVVKEFWGSRESFFALSTPFVPLWDWVVGHLRGLTNSALPPQSKLTSRIRIKELHSSRKKMLALSTPFVTFGENLGCSPSLLSALFTSIPQPVSHLGVRSKKFSSSRQKTVAFFAQLELWCVLRYSIHMVKINLSSSCLQMLFVLMASTSIQHCGGKPIFNTSIISQNPLFYKLMRYLASNFTHIFYITGRQKPWPNSQVQRIVL